jgi:hypothetical protein
MLRKFRLLCIFLGLLLSLQSFALEEELQLETEKPEKKSFLIGHNMTPTTEIPKPGVWTVGNYALAVGVSDHLFVATSPWIWVSYNTANIHFKWTKATSENSRFGFFASYFESYDSSPLIGEIGGSQVSKRPGSLPPAGPPAFAPLATTTVGGYKATTRYQWKSASLHSLYNYKFDSGTTTYLSLKYSYFWNDDFPYSIRMDPGRDDIRGQWDFTTLTNVPISNSDFSWNLEFGGLGLNYKAPYCHMGLSLGYASQSWLVTLGASYTAQFRELNQQSAWVPGRYDGRAHISQIDGATYYFRYLQTAMHPEVQVQYFF